MSRGYWDAALDSMTLSEPSLFGPQSFLEYLDAEGFETSRVRTASHISLNDRQELPEELVAADTVILRLGRSSGRGTQFALVTVPNKLSGFFINEAAFATERRCRDYRPDGDDFNDLSSAARDMLAAYRALPTFSETSFVNLALTTGVLSETLRLDTSQIATAPATVASTFGFSFIPHPSVPTELNHNSGQVEIDAVAVTRRNGNRVLVVIEAKTGGPRSLPKHKLAYPAYAMAASSEFEFDKVIPVYLRAQQCGSTITYDIYECSFPVSADGTNCLSALSVVSHGGFETII